MLLIYYFSILVFLALIFCSFAFLDPSLKTESYFAFVFVMLAIVALTFAAGYFFILKKIQKRKLDLGEDGFITALDQRRSIKYAEIKSIKIKRLMDDEIISVGIISDTKSEITLGGFEKMTEILEILRKKVPTSTEINELTLKRKPNSILRLVLSLTIAFGVLVLGFLKNKWGWFLLLGFFGTMAKGVDLILKPQSSIARKTIMFIFLLVYISLGLYVAFVIVSRNGFRILNELF
jgi:hypothetical protein